MTLVWWWLRPALGRARTRLGGNWFWGPLLMLAGGVPLSALGRVSPWICVTSAAALIACGAAALVTGNGRRAGDVLLFGSLAVLLLRAFWHLGRPVDVIFSVLVLTVTGVGIRGAHRAIVQQQ